MWTLKDQHVVRQFEDELNNLLEGDPNLISESLKDKWRHLKINLVKATEVSCGLSKNGKWRKRTWWWLVQLMMQWTKKGDWKIWKNSGSKEDYVLAKKVAKPRMFTAKKKAEKKKDEKYWNWYTHLPYSKTSEARKQRFCWRNNGVLAFNEDKKKAWKQHYERLLNVKFPWREEDLSTADPVLEPSPLIT